MTEAFIPWYTVTQKSKSSFMGKVISYRYSRTGDANYGKQWKSPKYHISCMSSLKLRISLKILQRKLWLGFGIIALTIFSGLLGHCPAFHVQFVHYQIAVWFLGFYWSLQGGILYWFTPADGSNSHLSVNAEFLSLFFPGWEWKCKGQIPS